MFLRGGLCALVLLWTGVLCAQIGKGLPPLRSFRGNEVSDVVVSEVSLLERNYNLVCWHDPILLFHELEQAQHVPEMKHWGECVRTLVKSLSYTYPAIGKKYADKKSRPQRIGNGKIIRAITQRDEEQHILLEQWDFLDTKIVEARRDLLAQLTIKVQEARAIQRSLTDKNAVVSLIRANYTLQRRLVLWNYCDHLMQLPKPTVHEVSVEQWRAVLDRVERLVDAHPYHDTWRSYLRLNVLLRFSDLSPESQREIAWQVMDRLHATQLAESQQKFLAQEAFQQLNALLTYYGAARLPEDYLMYAVENYETAEDIVMGNRIVMEMRRLELELGKPLTDKQKMMDQVYRNANLRLFVSREFLNSSLPQPGAEERTIQENVMNRPVYGRGVSNTALSIRMVPDDTQFRLGFLVEGTMKSSTYSPNVVTIYNNSNAQYVAFKEILFSEKGIQMRPAVAEVENRIQLQNLHTPLDPIPVIGFVANGVARNQAVQKQGEVSRLTEYKIQKEVCTTLDSQVNEKLAVANQFLQEKILTPLARLELNLERVDAQTTSDDAVIRMRLAGKSHPGAFTPRPVPPQDSQINFQLHESTLNNFLQQFHLEGRTFTVDTLVDHIQTRLPNLKLGENVLEPEEELFITFADKNAVTVHINNSTIFVHLSVQELRVGKRQWKNFEVEAPYLVQSGEKSIFVQRDGPVRLIGRIPVGQQVAVRGIFSKIFQKTKEKNILPDAFLTNPRFEKLVLDQLVLQDGWLGVSFGLQKKMGYASR